jgi:hypothetical protein
VGKLIALKVTKESLELVYRAYPRKQGKSKGMKVAWRDLKTPSDVESLFTAIRNYRAFLEKNHTSSQYVLMFSTFMNQWEDWLDLEHGSSESFDGKKVHDLSDIFPEKK